MPPLHAAIQRGDLESVLLLLQHKDIDLELPNHSKNWTPLCVALWARDLDEKVCRSVVEKLIALGANVNHHPNSGTHRFGYTPSHFAVQSGDVELVQLLLDNGAVDSLHLRSYGTGCSNSTPLDFAKSRGDTAIIRLLEEYSSPVPAAR